MQKKNTQIEELTKKHNIRSQLMQEHGLVTYEEQLHNFAPYRHFVKCNCGFESRMSTKEAVQDQFNRHLATHGVPGIDWTKQNEELENKKKGLLGKIGGVFKKIGETVAEVGVGVLAAGTGAMQDTTIDPKSTEKPPYQKPTDYDTLVNYVKSRGYSQETAEGIVQDHELEVRASMGQDVEKGNFQKTVDTSKADTGNPLPEKQPIDYSTTH